MPSPPPVLVVGHDASRTGAPGLALRWVRWAVAHDAARPAVWLDRGGPLVPEFAALCPTTVAAGAHHHLRRRASGFPAAARLLRRVDAPRHPADRSPIVLANTVAAWSAAAAVRRRSRLVVWVHELDHVAERILGGERESLLAQTDHLVAEGDRVAAMLRDRWGVPAHQVTVVDSFIDRPTDPPATGSGPATGSPRADVVAVGSLTARKAPDAFVATVAALRTLRPNVRAAWLGGPTDGPVADLVRHDLASAGLTDAVDLAGETDDVAPWLSPGAVFVHPAREDPAPVAVLEAAMRGMAVVTWDTGGAADLVRRAGEDRSVVAPGDVLALARRTAELLADPDHRDAAGRALRSAAEDRTTDRLAPELLRAVIGGPS